MNVVREINDRIDVVADWLGFGDVDEPRDAIRLTRRPADDRDYGMLAIDAGERVMIAFAAALLLAAIVTQTIMWHGRHEPVGTYYVERSSSVSGFGDR